MHPRHRLRAAARSSRLAAGAGDHVVRGRLRRRPRRRHHPTRRRALAVAQTGRRRAHRLPPRGVPREDRAQRERRDRQPHPHRRDAWAERGEARDRRRRRHRRVRTRPLRRAPRARESRGHHDLPHQPRLRVCAVQHREISGLEVRHASGTAPTRGGRRGAQLHHDGPSGIWAQGNNLVFRNNTLAFNGGGIHRFEGHRRYRVPQRPDRRQRVPRQRRRPAGAHLRVHSVYAEACTSSTRRTTCRCVPDPGAAHQGSLRRHGDPLQPLLRRDQQHDLARVRRDNEALVANDPSYRERLHLRQRVPLRPG
jgi:hypothetical protein